MSILVCLLLIFAGWMLVSGLIRVFLALILAISWLFTIGRR